MATIFRTRAVFKTQATGPDCLITNYWASTGAGTTALATESVARVRAAWAALGTSLASGSAFSPVLVVDEIEETTGAIVNQFTAAAPAAVSFSATGSLLPIQTQALATKQTALFRDGRRVKGRQFIPGLTAVSATAAGLPTGSLTTAITAFNTALGATIVTATNEYVWSRPRVATPFLAARSGLAAIVSVRAVSPQFAVLRSRRT